MVDYPQTSGGSSDLVEPLLISVGGNTYAATVVVESDTTYSNPCEDTGDYDLDNMIQGSGKVISNVPTGLISATMTANEAPSGKASADDQLSATYAAWKAFDGDKTTANNGWNPGGGLPTPTAVRWLQYEPTSAKAVLNNKVYNRNGIVASIAAAKMFGTTDQTTADTEPGQGIADYDSDVNWIELDDFTNSDNTDGAVIRDQPIANDTPFVAVRLVITAANGGETYVSVGEWEVSELVTITPAIITQQPITYPAIPNGLTAIVLIKDTGERAPIVINSNVIVEAADDLGQTAWTPLNMSAFVEVVTDVWQYNSSTLGGLTGDDISIRIRTLDAAGGIPAIEVYTFTELLT